MPLPFLAQRQPACPFCYQKIDLGQVGFRCSGRAEAGRPACGTYPDPVFRDIIGDASPQRPVVAETHQDGSFVLDEYGRPRLLLGRSSQTCRRCGGATHERMCPHCHSRLPVDLRDNSTMIGMVGARNSGKTVMLSVLQRELTRTVARRFDASIDAIGDTGGLARDLEANRQAMEREGGALPPQTAATGGARKSPAVYEWRYQKGNRQKSTIFSLYDNAGEDVSDPQNALNQTYLSAADGIILLLDPFSFPENLGRPGSPRREDTHAPEATLDAITTVLQTAHGARRGRKISQPLAVVISKIDAFFDDIPPQSPLLRPSSSEPSFNEQEATDVHEHMASLVDSWGGDNLLRKLRHNYDRFQLFGASALGAEPDYAHGLVNARGVLPHRVEEPFLWLMACQRFIPTVRG